jgi:hypothetical protein
VTTGSYLNWTTTQQVLFDDADADVLILLDCCYAASARFRAASTGKGTKEILAACSNKLPTTGVEYRSFTSVLTDELKEAAIENQLRGSSLSVVELHGFMHDNRKLQYQPIYARVSRNRYHTISLIPFRDATQLRCEVMTPDGSTSSASSSPQLRINTATRVLLSIHTSRSPTEDLICFLKNECMLPLYVTGMKIEEVVRIEGIYESNSTLTLVSIPLPVWDLIPDHAACHYVGLIRSENLCQHESVQQLFAQVKSHGASATSSSACSGQQQTWSDCRGYSGSSPSPQLRITRTESYAEPILTPQDSPEGSPYGLPSADNAHDRSLTGLEKVAAPSSLGTQSGLPQSYESCLAFPGKLLMYFCSPRTNFDDCRHKWHLQRY